MPNTKIVATLGPASDSPEILSRLLETGASVIRLNASHGTQEKHAERIEAIRAAAEALGRHVGILLDLQGPKIRLGTFEEGFCELETGARFEITTEPVLGNCRRAYTTYSRFAYDVKQGDRVLLADGAVELRALSTDGATVIFDVIEGGTIGDNKGINLPGVAVSTDAITDKDLSDLRFGLHHRVDFLALSFVRSAEDVNRLRRYMGAQAAAVPVIAKIEKPEAWENIGEIIATADGVMVARGDLGVEVALERVPFIQKEIIRLARQAGKFVITATQMLESMVNSPVPTRAEVSDVANAIYDGSDAVMLSAETSIGRYPLEAVRYMTRIAAETEASLAAYDRRERIRFQNPSRAEIIARSAYYAAEEKNIDAVVVFTESGSSARQIARLHPEDPVYALTPNAEVARRLAIQFGVTAILADKAASTDDMLALSDRMLQEKGFVRAGDTVVFVAGQPVGHPGTTNLMKIHRVGELE
ncbi:MAG: pyruvate kinase [Bryobacterales bacterium]|nr:pyruvate kinase [Bryobacterales bacterium]